MDGTERKDLVIYPTDERCLFCSACYETPYEKSRRYQCLPASTEEYLHRRPTAEDMKNVFKRIAKGSVKSIPSGCSNGYRSPENLPLR